MIKMETISKKSQGSIISLEDLLLILGGFFISRVNILNNLSPFGLAYMGALILRKRDHILLPLSIGLGLLTIHGLSNMNYQITSILIYLILSQKLKEKSYRPIEGARTVGLIFFFLQFIWTISRARLSYDLLVLGFESLMVFTMTYVFSSSFIVEGFKIKALKKDQVIASILTMILILSGINNISIFGLLVKNLVSISLILYISYNQGMLAGLGIAVAIGLVSYISHIEMPFIISILAVGGLLAGIFRELGKSATILGFLLGNAIISFYINRFGNSFFNYKELLAASLIFLIVSKYIDIDLSLYFDRTFELRKSYENRRFDLMEKKLEKTRDLFKSLGEILEDSIEEERSSISYDVYSIIDNISQNACKNCSEFQTCWQEDYYGSYNSIFKLLGLIESKLDKDEILIESLGDSCINKDYLLKEAKEVYRNFKERQAHNIKLMEQRKLLSDQIFSLEKIIENIKIDLVSQVVFHKDIEEDLISELKYKGIEVLDLIVVEVEKDNFEVLVEIDLLGDPRNKMDRIKNLVSKHLDLNFSVDYSYGPGGGASRTFKLSKSSRYSSFTSIEHEVNSEELISGDNFTFGEIARSSFMAISDGMGIGRKANQESSTAIRLLEKLMEVGMDKETIIKTINSILRVKTNEEIFTTLDLGLIDLYTGKLQILKNGSATTFIKKKDGVKLINSKSLPLGILENVDLDLYEEDLEDGDIVIMISDGVLESNRSVNDLEDWMRKTIERIKSHNPQAIAREIMEVAKFVAKDDHRDDMTIMATKIWKNI